MKGLIAKKGMTQVFDEDGDLIPVTVIRVEPNTVKRPLKTKENSVTMRLCLVSTI